LANSEELKLSKMEKVRQIYETSDRPVWSLSVDEIKGVVRAVVYDAIADVMSVDQDKVLISSPSTDQPKYIYGLKGIRKEFGVGANLAQRLKDTVLRDAVMQSGPGCKIIVDRAMARKLYSEHMEKEGKK
jgi:hypothetical protein